MASETDDVEAVRKAPRRRKCKNRLVQLAEIYPDIAYYVAAVYGPPDDQVYVMQVDIGEKVYQGIGPSKIKAKIMAAELVLIDHALLDSMTASPTDMVEVASAADFTADCLETLLYYDFNRPYPVIDQSVAWSAHDPLEHSSADALPDNAPAIPDEPSSVVEEYDWSRFIGKNSLTIIVELGIEARYQLLAETGDQLHPLFAMAVTIEGEMFRACGSNKKLAKARAARNALSKFYGLEFSIAQNGMPIYEGNEDIWEEFRAKLEKEAELQMEPGRNPLLVLLDFFPEAVYEQDNTVDASHFYTAKVTVLRKLYTGLGRTRTDAKTNAAANALEGLRASGQYVKREREILAARQILPPVQLADNKLTGLNKNAVGKLNILLRDRVRYCDLSETPVSRTSHTAFTVAVSVDGQHYVGVAKTKKLARAVAAERALVAMEMWTDEDESAKMDALMELDEDPVEAVHRIQRLSAQQRDRHAWATWSSHADELWNEEMVVPWDHDPGPFGTYGGHEEMWDHDPTPPGRRGWTGGWEASWNTADGSTSWNSGRQASRGYHSYSSPSGRGFPQRPQPDSRDGSGLRGWQKPGARGGLDRWSSAKPSPAKRQDWNKPTDFYSNVQSGSPASHPPTPRQTGTGAGQGVGVVMPSAAAAAIHHSGSPWTYPSTPAASSSYQSASCAQPAATYMANVYMASASHYNAATAVMPGYGPYGSAVPLPSQPAYNLPYS